MKKTKVINFYGGPSSGKSTIATNCQGQCKLHGINCDYTGEYAKDLAWEDILDKRTNQIYIFGKQHHRQFRLKDKVDLIITDSPLPLCTLYDKDCNEHLQELIFHEFNKYDNVNIFVKRVKSYLKKGRTQTEEEAKEIDQLTLNMLKERNIPFHTVNGDWSGVNQTMDIILKELNINNLYKLQKR